MTRINVVPVETLSRLHLQSEYKEITRVFTLVSKAQSKGKNKWNIKAPKEYTLGTGHVLFFYPRLKYILNRYNELSNEMRNRGYSPNQIPDESLIARIHPSWMGDYTPTPEAVEINLQRIRERS